MTRLVVSLFVLLLASMFLHIYRTPLSSLRYPFWLQSLLHRLLGIHPAVAALGVGVLPLSLCELCRILGWEISTVGFRAHWVRSPGRPIASGISLILAGIGCSLITYQYCTPSSLLDFWFIELRTYDPTGWTSTLAFLLLNGFFLLMVLEFSRWMGSTQTSHEKWECSSPVADVFEHGWSLFRILFYLLVCIIMHHFTSGSWRFPAMMLASTPLSDMITTYVYFLWLWTTPSSAQLRGEYHTEVEPVVSRVVSLFWGLGFYIVFRTSTNKSAHNTVTAMLLHVIGAVIGRLQLLEMWRWRGREVRMVDGWPHVRMRARQIANITMIN